MKIKYITFTGIDNSTDVETLVDLSRKYPHIEWGIMFSSHFQGVARNPSYDWIAQLAVAAHYEPTLHLSAHLTGGFVRQYLKMPDACNVMDNLDLLFAPFQRIQINHRYTQYSPEAIPHIIANIRERIQNTSKTVITLENTRNQAITQALTREPLPNHALLYDAALGCYGWNGFHECDTEPIRSPHPAVPTGYACGITADTLLDALIRIETNVPKHYATWVDIRRGFTTDGDGIDCDKIERIMNAIDPKYFE